MQPTSPHGWHTHDNVVCSKCGVLVHDRMWCIRRAGQRNCPIPRTIMCSACRFKQSVAESKTSG